MARLLGVRIIAVGMTLIVAACQTTSTLLSEEPTSPTPSQVEATPSPSGPAPTTRPILGRPTDAVIVTITQDMAGPFDLLVELVTFGGERQTLAEFAPFRINGVDDFQLDYPPKLVPSKDSWLATIVESPAGSGSSLLKLVLVDLANGSIQVVETKTIRRGAKALWAPSGQLAVDDGFTITTMDPPSGAPDRVRVPDNTYTFGAWASDESGWAASHYDVSADRSTVGLLGRDGTFRPGLLDLYRPTGLERFWGASGAMLASAVGDGPSGAVTIIYEAGSEPQVQWFVLREPSDDPRAELLWDATGSGMWYLLDYGSRVDLAHRDAPGGAYDVRASFPRTGHATFAGAAPDDSSFIVFVHAELDGESSETLWVDAVTGEILSLGHAPNIASFPPLFAGWAGG
jgi:hypothetical protein